MAQVTQAKNEVLCIKSPRTRFRQVGSTRSRFASLTGSYRFDVTKLAVVLGVLLSFIPRNGLANDYSQGIPWQFQTTQDRTNKALIADLIERREAGMYDIDNNYNIAGDLVNCTQSANSVGNSETISQDAPIGSPSIRVDGSIGADATGNTSSTDVKGGSAGIPQSGMNTGMATSSEGGSMSGSSQILNASESKGVNSSNEQDFTGNSSETDQSTSDSSLSATVRESDMDTSVLGTTGNGGSGQVALNSTQELQSSNVQTSISESSACAFTELTGAGETTFADRSEVSQ